MRTSNPVPACLARHALFLLAGGFLLIPEGAQAGYIFQNVVNSGDPTFNQELGINNAGTIAGYFGSGAPGSPNKGYTVVSPFSQASFTNENFPGSVQTQVTGINGAGNTVGFWVDASGANHGFTDIGNIFTNVDDPLSTSAPIFTQLLGLNNSGEAVGFYNDVNGNANGFAYNTSLATFTPVDPPDATMSAATALNNAGEVAGFLTSSINGDTYGYLDMNNAFQIFLFPGSTFTQFFGINNEGLVVGDYTDSNGNTHGLVFNSVTDVWQTVDDPFAVTGPGNGTIINGINDNGQIVGFYVNAEGSTIGLVGTATPEPGSLALVGLGALLIGWRWKKARG
jgi:hypothetical protein